MMKTGYGAKIGLGVGAAMLLSFSIIYAVKNEFIYRAVWDQGSIHRFADDFNRRIEEAGNSGYNTMIFVDHNLQTIEKQPKKWFDSYARAMATAKKSNIKLIPQHFWQSYPAWEDFNLAETFPVRGTRFLVKNGEARGVGDHDISLKNGGFETSTGGKPANWRFTMLSRDDYALDQSVKKSGSVSLRITTAPPFSLISQSIKVKPFRAYQISAWFRTEGLDKYEYTKVQFAVTGKTALLNRRYRPFGTPKRWSNLSPNMNWTKCVIDFNSLTSTSATLQLWFSYKHPQPGTLWVDNIEIREVGLYEALRAVSKPVVVKSADGSFLYEEGKDYVVDPECSEFTADDYDYEAHLKIPQGSAINEGQELRVDWYQYANVETIIPESDFCLAKTWEALQDNLNRIDQLMGNTHAMYTHIDEWRVAGWNPDCAKFKFKTGGEYIAKMWEGVECMLRRTNACRTVFTESDMFDPFHNGWDGPYCMVKDGAYGSFNGLSKDVIVLNWNMYKNWAYTQQSLAFFAGKDPKYPNVKTRQVLNVLDPGMASSWVSQVEKAEAKGIDGIVGVVYTDWEGRYEHVTSVANVFRARGRWPANPFPVKTCAPATSCPGFDHTAAITGRTFLKPVHRTSMKVVRSHTGSYQLEYTVSEYKPITLKVFDLQGREIQTLAQGKKEIGAHNATWNTSVLPAGIYFLRLSIDGVGQQTLKQVVF